MLRVYNEERRRREPTYLKLVEMADGCVELRVCMKDGSPITSNYTILSISERGIKMDYNFDPDNTTGIRVQDHGGGKGRVYLINID